MLLQQIQKNLELMYGFECALNVTDFLLAFEHIEAMQLTLLRETLLVQHVDDEVLLGLYLDPHILENASKIERCIDSYCCVAEGISHWLYVTFNAHRTRSVTQLELELQAEVDKFLLCVLDESRDKHVQQLHLEMFGNVEWIDLEGTEIRDRYEKANRFAAKYCATLYKKFLCKKLQKGSVNTKERDISALLAEVRAFYRLNQAAKLERIREIF
jgi:hypothetical protein